MVEHNNKIISRNLLKNIGILIILILIRVIKFVYMNGKKLKKVKLYNIIQMMIIYQSTEM